MLLPPRQFCKFEMKSIFFANFPFMLMAEENLTPIVLAEILQVIWAGCWKKRHNLGKQPLLYLAYQERHLTHWWGLTLLSVACEVLSQIILSRLTTTVDPLLRKEQAGFRKGIPNLHTLTNGGQMVDRAMKNGMWQFMPSSYRLW